MFAYPSISVLMFDILNVPVFESKKSVVIFNVVYPDSLLDVNPQDFKCFITAS